MDQWLPATPNNRSLYHEPLQSKTLLVSVPVLAMPLHVMKTWKDEKKEMLRDHKKRSKLLRSERINKQSFLELAQNLHRSMSTCSAMGPQARCKAGYITNWTVCVLGLVNHLGIHVENYLYIYIYILIT